MGMDIAWLKSGRVSLRRIEEMLLQVPVVRSADISHMYRPSCAPVSIGAHTLCVKAMHANRQLLG